MHGRRSKHGGAFGNSNPQVGGGTLARRVEGLERSTLEATEHSGTAIRVYEDDVMRRGCDPAARAPRHSLDELQRGGGRLAVKELGQRGVQLLRSHSCCGRNVRHRPGPADTSGARKDARVQ